METQLPQKDKTTTVMPTWSAGTGALSLISWKPTPTLGTPPHIVVMHQTIKVTTPTVTEEALASKLLGIKTRVPMGQERESIPLSLSMPRSSSNRIISPLLLLKTGKPSPWTVNVVATTQASEVTSKLVWLSLWAAGVKNSQTWAGWIKTPVALVIAQIHQTSSFPTLRLRQAHQRLLHHQAPRMTTVPLARQDTMMIVTIVIASGLGLTMTLLSGIPKMPIADARQVRISSVNSFSDLSHPIFRIQSFD